MLGNTICGRIGFLLTLSNALKKSISNIKPFLSDMQISSIYTLGQEFEEVFIYPF